MAKTWFITGASSGFGRQLAALLLERGDRVAATVRKPGTLDDLSAVHGDRLWVGVLDVTDKAAVRDTIDRAFAELQPIDVVVSNAGYALFGAAEEVTDAQIRRQIDTNLIGSINVARAAIPNLRRQGGGRIIQISSSVGQAAYPTMGVYAATKWAIEGFFEGTIPEIAPFGIAVTLVEPGASRTNFASSSADAGAPMEIYDTTPAGDFRRLVATAGLAMFPGDPRKVAAAIIASADQHPAPKRLTLGSDAYALVQKALTERLADLEQQKALAHSTDVDAPAVTPQRHPFLDDLADGVILQSSVLRRPVSGRDAVLKVVKAAAAAYRSQTPRFLGSIRDRTYFEYEAALTDGTMATGLVAVVKDKAGAVTDLTVTFSPFGAVQSIAEVLRQGLGDALGTDLVA